MVEMRTLYLDDLVVDKDYREKGLPHSFTGKWKRGGEKAGAKRLDLMVWEFNERARRFYENQGMRPQRYIYEKEL